MASSSLRGSWSELRPLAARRAGAVSELLDLLRAAMGAYMKDHFAFAGIASPERRRLHTAARASIGDMSEDELGEFALACWAEPEREYQYAACDEIERAAAKGRLSRASLDVQSHRRCRRGRMRAEAELCRRGRLPGLLLTAPGGYLLRRVDVVAEARDPAQVIERPEVNLFVAVRAAPWQSRFDHDRRRHVISAGQEI